jgi:hypothetical protein
MYRLMRGVHAKRKQTSLAATASCFVLYILSTVYRIQMALPIPAQAAQYVQALRMPVTNWRYISSQQRADIANIMTALLVPCFFLPYVAAVRR